MPKTNGNGSGSHITRIHYALPQEVVVLIVPSERAIMNRSLRKKTFNFFPPRTIRDYLKVVESLRSAGVIITKQMRRAIYDGQRDRDLVQSFYEMLVDDDYVAMIGFAILDEQGWCEVRLIRKPRMD